MDKTSTTTPYHYLLHSLLEAGANRIAECDGPNKPPHPGASTLEFWLVPRSPNPARLIIIQRWTQSGGFDYYTQGERHTIEHALAEILDQPVKE